MSSSPEFLINFKKKLDTGDFQSANLSLIEVKNKENLKEYGWELTGIICSFLKSDDVNVLHGCSKCLQTLSEECKPKQVLLGVNEHFGTISSTRGLAIILECCAVAFAKIDRKPSLFLKEILEGYTFSSKNLIRLEDDTLLVRNNLSLYKDIVQVLFTFTDTLESIRYPSYNTLEDYYSNLRRRKLWNEYEIEKCRRITLTNLFIALEPLYGFVVDYISTESEEDEDMKSLITSLSKRIHWFSDVSRLPYTDFKNGHLGYLVYIYTELKKGSMQTPTVFSSKKWYLTHKPLITPQLAKTSTSIIYFALEVHAMFLNLLQLNSLNEKDSGLMFEVLNELSKIMIWCERKSLRIESKRQFDLLLQKCTPRGRYQSLRLLYKDNDNPSLRGYLIGLIGNILKQDDYQYVLQNETITELALLFTNLDEGENILQESERLMSGLNFLRYWLLKDKKNQNKTGVWDHVKKISNKCQHLRCGIGMLVAHLQNFLHTNNEQESLELELTIPGGEILRNMSREDKEKFAQSAVSSLEMMVSVIARILEILDT